MVKRATEIWATEKTATEKWANGKKGNGNLVNQKIGNRHPVKRLWKIGQPNNNPYLT